MRTFTLCNLYQVWRNQEQQDEYYKVVALLLRTYRNLARLKHILHNYQINPVKN